jgi:acetyl esterase/lipase
MRCLTKSLLAIALVLGACATETLDTAPPSQVPPPIAAQLKKIGRVIDPFETPKLYLPLAQLEPYQGVRVTRDVHYGAAERNLLDVFVADPGGGGRPVLVFVHGGGYILGDKRTWPGSPWYDNIMLWAARSGFVGVNMTYRLAPRYPWPAAQQDIAAALLWIQHNIGAHGGDPARVVLMGHSSGATHVAEYLGHEEFHVGPGAGVAGAILMSGLFDPSTVEPSPGLEAYFGSDKWRYAERSALQGMARSRVPVLLVVAELDPSGVHVQAEQARRFLCKAAMCPQTLKLLGHNHASEILSVNTEDKVLTDALRAFVAGR